MATNISGSLTQDSDEVKEMYCEECERHGDGYATAVAFCIDCLDYICVTCQRYHKRQFKTHKIQDNNSMPQEFYFEKCTTHPGQLVKFYCIKCNKEACQECRDNDHVNCSDVNHLPTLASDIQKSDDLINFTNNVDQLSKDIKDTEKLINAKSEVIKKQEENATDTCIEHSNKLIATYKQHLQHLVDDFDKKMEDTIAKLKKERLELLQKVSEKERQFEEKVRKAESNMKEEVVSTNTNFKVLKSEHLNLVGNLKALTVDLEQAQKLGKNCELLIKLKLVKQICKEIQVTTDQIQHSYIQRYKLKESDIPPTIQSLEDQTRFFKQVHVSAEEKKIAFNFDINHKFDSIISLLVLSEHTLLALDNFSCSLVIFSLEKSNAKYIKEISFNKQPCGIAKVSDYKVAVTFLDKEMIRLITFSEEMEILDTTEIPGNGCCYGITYSNNHLVVSYNFTESIKILNMSGKIVKSFDKDDTDPGQILFTYPDFLTVSPDNTMIYVSDCGTHTVTCLTFDGKVKVIYKDDQLKFPQQLAVDEYGSVYVCGYHSNNVHQLSPDLTKVKILIDESHGILGPKSIAYCQNTKRLFVGMYENCKIKAYNVALE